jgi:hypothetical protein
MHTTDTNGEKYIMGNYARLLSNETINNIDKGACLLVIHDLVEVIKDFMCDQPVDKRHAFRLLAEADGLINGK